jgi:predicted nucleotidyltransferase component of viral defense system
MMIDLLDKAQLTVINRNNFVYPLAVAEKDYFLTVVLQIIYHSKLKDKLVFKGGTAIHHLYLDQLRFSEDLDFTALEPVSIDDLVEVFKPYDFLEIVKFYPSSFALKIERLKFIGPLGQANSIKIDISFDQKLVLPANELEYKNIYNAPVTVSGMALKEICAEKVRAINERARYRDFYDLAMILKVNPIEAKEILEILSQKKLRKTLSKDLIFANLKLANEIREDGSENLYYREEISSGEIKKTLDSLLNLL